MGSKLLSAVAALIDHPEWKEPRKFIEEHLSFKRFEHDLRDQIFEDFVRRAPAGERKQMSEKAKHLAAGMLSELLGYDAAADAHKSNMTVVEALLDQFAAERMAEWLQEKEPHGFVVELLARADVGCVHLHDAGECDDCDVWRLLRAKRKELTAQAQKGT